MKKLSLTVFLLLFAIGISAQENSASQGMAFLKGTWQEVRDAAKDQDKFIFVDAFADWCGPCKWMDANVFPTEEAGNFYNKNFIVYKFDMEKGEGPEFAEKYKVDSYPSYLFFNSDGKLVHRSGGSKPVNDFIEDGKNALDPDKALYVLKEKYDSGERSRDLLFKYSVALNNAGMNSSKVSKEFLDGLTEEEYLEKSTWEFFKEMVSDINSPLFVYVNENRGKYEQKFGKVEVDRKITYSTMNYYANKQEWKKFAKPAADYAAKYAYDNSQLLNSIAWAFYENIDDNELLNKAVVWARRAVDLEKNYYNVDTYAALLYKTGQYKDALKAAEDAVNLAKAENRDAHPTMQLIEMIKKKM